MLALACGWSASHSNYSCICRDHLHLSLILCALFCGISFLAIIDVVQSFITDHRSPIVHASVPHLQSCKLTCHGTPFCWRTCVAAAAICKLPHIATPLHLLAQLHLCHFCKLADLISLQHHCTAPTCLLPYKKWHYDSYSRRPTLFFHICVPPCALLPCNLFWSKFSLLV